MVPTGVRLRTGHVQYRLAAGVGAFEGAHSPGLAGAQVPALPPPPCDPGSPHCPGTQTGSCMYLQPLKPLVVAVHQPGPLWGHRGAVSHVLSQAVALTRPLESPGSWSPPAPSATEPAAPSPPPPLPGPSPTGGRSRHPHLPASSSPLQTQTGGQIQGPYMGKETKVTETPTSAYRAYWAPQMLSSPLPRPEQCCPRESPLF